MQRGTSSLPASARPSAAAAARTARAAPSIPDTLVLRATPSIKRYNIARFDVPQVPTFSACPQPVMMYPEPERAPDEDEEKKDEEPVGYNPALRKRRRRRRKDTRTAGWVIEDQEGKNKFVGSFEGGQQSTYMLLVKNRHNDEFSVMPVEQWFRFKKPLGYRTLTLEEAEDLNNEKKRAVERWLMKHKLAGEDKADAGGDTISAPRMRTGAVGGSAKGAKAKGEGEDLFSVSESRPRAKVRAPKKSEEGGPTGEDGGDFDEKFDDDESEAEIDHEDVRGVASDSDEDEFEVDPEGTGKLTETGQAMKDLLKRAQSGEMLDAAADKDDEHEAGEDDEDEDFSAKDMDKIKREPVIRDLGGNIIHNRSDAMAGAGGDVNGKAGVAAGVGAGEKATGAADSKGASVDGAANGVSANGANSRKRSIEEVSGVSKKEDTPSKMKPGASGAGTTSTTRLTEAGVQQELMRYGGRMRTRDLLKKLRKLIVTDNDKALLKDILRTICDVEVDAIDGRLLVLKSQFR